MTNKLITTLLLDMGNVLVDLNIALAQRNIVDLLKPDITEVDVYPILDKYERGILSTSLFINAILRLCDHHVQARDVIIAWNSMLLGFPLERIQRLKELRSKYQLLLLSNNNELHKSWIDDYLKTNYGIEHFDKDYFDKTYYSHLIGCAKPDAEAYQYVVSDADIDPASTLFIDDMPINIAAAQDLGFQTMRLHPNAEWIDLMDAIHT